jgi:FO synthase
MTPTAAQVRRSLGRARDGRALDVAEAAVLLAARDDDLAELCRIAAGVRDQGLAAAGRPAVIAYSRKVFIPLTRLCRDRCHYCTFATVPGRLPAPYLSPDEVLEIARRGAELGCKEALFTLGDRPEERWPQAAEWLEAHGYADTLSYVRAMAILVLEQTGLLPHLNPGVMSWSELQRLRPVAPSMGLMLETIATRIWSEPGGAHFGSPDKEPRVRLRTIEEAGRHSIPFTTGILVGIGETLTERAESIFAIRSLARTYGHIQEVIIQNFRAKPDTAMRSSDDLPLDEYLATIAVGRLILGAKARVQVPPNLTDVNELEALIGAGIDDWGGVSPLTPDHVNPERPWPHLDELRARTEAAGFTLHERLTVHPEYVRRAEAWLDPRIKAHVAALADNQGLADESVHPVGRPWQEPDPALESYGRVDLQITIDTAGRTTDRRADFDEVYGDWTAIGEQVAELGRTAPAKLPGDVLTALRNAETDPGELSDADALTLMSCDGKGLEALCNLADAIRVDRVGDDVTYVVNRNINFTNVCYTGCRFCAFAQRRTDADAFSLSLDEVSERAREAWDVGATEICMQGGIDPQLSGADYFDLARAIKRGASELHLHAFSPMEVVNGAARSGLSIPEFLAAAREAGVDSLPGTAAEILDDEVRWVLTKGKLPTSAWIEVVQAAHRLGIPTTSTMMYGHVDEPRHWVAHIRLLGRLQDETGGFTEFVPLPFIHHNAPIYLAGVARPGPTGRDNRAVHAMARIMLTGRIDNIQCSWVKLGDEGCQTVLRGGVNDLGGTLMEETISRMAGSENGSAKTPREIAAVAEGIGRPIKQRTTSYGRVPDERLAAAAEFETRQRRSLQLVDTD